MKDWFTVDEIDQDTYVISEYRHWEETHCYVLNGNTHCLVIDTGLGIQNIYEEINKLTTKPIICIATHIHWDHIGGHAYFKDIYVHENETKWLQGAFPIPLSAVKKMVVERCDLPDDFDVESYEIFQGTPSKILHGEEELDLGNRKIKVLLTPGHSPGHMCFWEEEKGYLFSGDLVYKDMLYANYPSTDPLQYLHSLETISKLDVKKIFPAHHDVAIRSEIITRMLHVFQMLQDAGKLHHGSGKFYYDDWSLWI